ncbi:GNAT family N-acetyltransferase [Endozoicomonas sp. ALB032]|uniref:GNAT family N-acetyltransferase n=1 Tax=Endozoicomonas sp. ALB032 TaxID=3403082 RepID=UPI003BB7D699
MPTAKPMPDGKYPICAFYTIAPGSISRKTLPASLAKKLPGYPVPVFLLAQLAVHKGFKVRGLGKIALIKALEYLYDINAHMGAYAVIVDCLNDNIAALYEQFGFESLTKESDRERMFLSMKTVQLLFDK